MADVYEQNLEQKSSLTTSDYIRVVGSDNVSYKQLVSDVANVAVQNAYLLPPTALTSGADVMALDIGTYYAPSNAVAESLVNAPSGLTLNCRVEVEGRLSYPVRKLITITDSSNSVWKNQMTSATTWSGWYKFPAQPHVEGLSNIIAIHRLGTAVDVTSAQTYTVPNNSRHLLIFTGPYASRGHAVYVVSANGSGNVYAWKIGGTDDWPAQVISSNSNVLTIANTSTSATYCAVVDIDISGSAITLATT